MALDARKNFAYSTVLTAPSPATSGTSLVVQSGDGAKFAAASFNAIVWPTGAQPTTSNAEIVRVTAISTDTFTITRTQESTSARTIIVGDQIAGGFTSKALTDIENYLTGVSAPTFLTPALGTPASGVMTNVTGLPNAGLATGAGQPGGAWTTFTPSLVNVSGGTLNFAKYTQVGKTIHFRIKYTMAGAGVAAGVTFTPPATLNSDYAGADVIEGVVSSYDISALTGYSGVIKVISTTSLEARTTHTDGPRANYEAMSTTNPITWAVNDVLTINGTYEAA